MVQKDIRIPVLLGPTAVGKTSLLMEFADRFDYMDVIMCDSRQIYRKMDIGTAKVSLDERKKLRHYLVDIVDINEKYGAGQFRRDALRLISMILKEGRIPVVSGGTGLYADALINGLSRIDDIPDDIRERVRKEWEVDREKLLEELKKTDYKLYRKLHPNDKQRIIRAIEVYRYTGIPLSVWWENGKEKAEYEFEIIVLNDDREELKRRIKKRVDIMLKQGWIEEVKELLEIYDKNDYGFKTVGYREIIEFLEGKIKGDDLPDKIYSKTWQYAKRQITWFKRYGLKTRKESWKILETLLKEWGN